ncbi:MAG: glycerophosphodiester phosphodiesterase [Cardiobacterium sp.]|nr:MAG: glycerophosphodiester phosphodiesterase [Cardiobacterium sp.]
MTRSLTLAVCAALATAAYAAEPLTYGVRPFYLIDNLEDGALKDELKACAQQTPKKSEFSIAHRGAALQFPEHTRDSYLAGAREGAGILECDVAFTKDKELVCRHAQNDLHNTTNILATPLAAKCSVPFKPAEYDADGKLVKEAEVECRTSDITLAEFKTLKGKMDGGNKGARSVEEYMQGTPAWRTEMYAQNGELMTHKESIELFKSLGVKMTPELKEPVVAMPYEGFTLEQYAQKMLDDYAEAGVAPSDVFPQSFQPEVIRYWLAKGGDYGKQAVFLDETLDTAPRIKEMPEWRKLGLQYLSPAMPMLVKNDGGKFGVSDYAKAAKDNGLKLITWTLERSGPIAKGGGWYFTGVEDLGKKDGDIYNYLDVLAKDVGIIGIFSDWPATVTYYANCKGL